MDGTPVWVDISYEEGILENVFIGEMDLHQPLLNIVDFAKYRAYQLLDTDEFSVNSLKYYSGDNLMTLNSRQFGS